ncbi:MAG: DUF255 domain-containing protein [Candidatus Methanoperedens sp.]|nr:DUF255 domain-containing protein [Candidatus Methanoperedens sp.]
MKFYTDPLIALGATKEQGKPVFVYAKSESCGWCKNFEEETFTNKSVIKTLNQNFILVSIDVKEKVMLHTEIFIDTYEDRKN